MQDLSPGPSASHYGVCFRSFDLAQETMLATPSEGAILRVWIHRPLIIEILDGPGVYLRTGIVAWAHRYSPNWSNCIELLICHSGIADCWKYSRRLGGLV
jgi:hypothetical protein